MLTKKARPARCRQGFTLVEMLVAPTRRDSRSGFTLVEMLVVIAIIALLAAILFPTMSSAKKKARQASCVSRLQAIGVAVKAYHLDHKKYPATLSDLQKYLDFQYSGTTLNTGLDKLIDSDDLRLPANRNDLRSSYGGFGNSAVAVPANPANDCSAANVVDHPENCPKAATLALAPPGTPGPLGILYQGAPGQSTTGRNTMQLVYNYWGYDQNGFALCRTSAAPCGNANQSPLYRYQAAVASGGTIPNLPSGISKWANYPALANKSAPENTIITHCVFQRSSWGSYDAGTGWDGNTIDLILRLDGSVRAVKLQDMAGKWIAQSE